MHLHRITSFSHRLLIRATQIKRDMPHYCGRQWSQQDLEVLQGLSKQLRMYCAKIRAALAPIREAVSPMSLCLPVFLTCHGELS